MCFRDVIASALFLLVKQYAHLVNNIHIIVLVCILVSSVKNELTVLIKSLGLPLLHAQVPALFVASTSSYSHESPLTSGHHIKYARGTVDTPWNVARFNAFDHWFYNGYKHGSNTNSERDPLPKTEVPLKWNRSAEHTYWVPDQGNTDRH